MAPFPQPTRRADLEETEKTIGLREILDELAKSSQSSSSTAAPLAEISGLDPYTNSQMRCCLALISHPPPLNLQYLSQPTPPATGFILTSPHRKFRSDTDTEGTYSSLPFGKEALLVHVLGVTNPDGTPNFQSRTPPVQYLEIDLFRPVMAIARQETRLKRTRRLLESTAVDYENNSQSHHLNTSSQDLAPLTMFRILTYLRVEGMVQSHLAKIWQCVWLNPHLHTLVLSLSCDGKKLLSEDIRSARLIASYHPDMRAACQGLTRTNLPEKIPLIRLSLTNFNVDAEPFQWFDHRKLRELELIECLDTKLVLKGEEWRDIRVIGIVGQMKADLTSRYVVGQIK